MQRDREDRYGLVAIALHWTIALLFVCQIALGLTMERVASMALQFTLIQWHKSFSFVVLLLSLLRLAWRISSRGPQPAKHLNPAERLAAGFVQASLYLLLIAVPMAGWALVSTSTLDIPSYAFNTFIVPDLPLARTDAAEAFWRQTHTLLAYVAAGVATLHILAALRHHFWLRDGLLRRMNPLRLR